MLFLEDENENFVIVDHINNYYEKKSSPKQPAVQEHMDSDESSSDVPTSVFSQVN